MSDQQNSDTGGRDGMRSVGDDAHDRVHIGFKGIEREEVEEPPVQVHDRHNPHDHAHVDLRQDEYTPEEVARLIGTSLDVVMHAIRSGDLKADRQGQAVVCITHADVVHWLRTRGPGV